MEIKTQQIIDSIPEIKELYPTIRLNRNALVIDVLIDFATVAYFELNETGSKELLFERIISALEDAIKLNTHQVEKIKAVYERWKNDLGNYIY